VGLQASLRDPLVDTTVVGFSKPERIDAIVRSAKAELPGELWDELDALRPPPHAWLDARD
jgi:D-threo-aldose 1-dehydrogenase